MLQELYIAARYANMEAAVRAMAEPVTPVPMAVAVAQYKTLEMAWTGVLLPAVVTVVIALDF
jgi:hypothetical protein